MNRNGTYMRQNDSQNMDWVAQRVESSASFRRIVAHRFSIPRRYRTGSPPAWSPGWFIEYRDNDSAVVTVGADADENFWHRWETLRVYRDGKVELQEMTNDGELIWSKDK